ncbi:hypothetical protein [Glycomyces artemisiae]|uniref:Uncharacterized protein n=1 Tax=Glycomyces artemisiae TaxID=1076443 RepID=A0A2T0UWZ6_9ACTN|nr:hypothetical protein [Glycomyces artemisiae]PRY62450.1 hypothetical protein B0I28_101784 [Glycomyces artemisiae]
MSARTTLRRTLRLAAGLAAALALALSTALLVQAPAQAGGGTFRYCFFVIDEETGTVERVCPEWEIPVEGPRKWWPKDCWVCLGLFDFEDYAVNPAERVSFYEQLGQGQTLLAQADLTKDEKLAEQLRSEAAAAFYSAAKLIDKGGAVSYKGFSWFDPQSGKVYDDPDPQPNLEFGSSVEAGLAYMQQAVLEPQPHPWIESAMKEFEQANAAIEAIAAG